MGNMSYCRFQNTDSDLSDCQDALESLVGNDMDADKLSRDELQAAKSLVERCQNIVAMLAEFAEECDNALEFDIGAAVQQANNELDDEA